jgi:hypothetical protein
MGGKDHLTIVWTNGDPITAEKMVFMYAVNSMRRGWWNQVTVVIWGSPAQLSAENAGIQGKIKEALDAGVHVTACKACADQLGVTEALEGMNVEVKYWGEPLTMVLKNGESLLTI